MTVPEVDPIISSAVVVAIGNGAGFTQGATSAPGWGSYRSRSRLRIARSWAKSPSAATNICGHTVRAGRTCRAGAAAKVAMRGLWLWIEQASKRLHRNMLAIALANKLARIAWAVLARALTSPDSTLRLPSRPAIVRAQFSGTSHRERLPRAPHRAPASPVGPGSLYARTASHRLRT